MALKLHDNRRSSSLSLSSLSAGDNREGPNAHTLTALLLEEKPMRDHEVEFNSRESTPYIMLDPYGVEHWRAIARAARDRLAKFIGKSAADDIRLSIPYMHYWKTQAEHYTEYWTLVTTASTDQLEVLRRTTAEDLRYSILDSHYWQTEATHYRRYVKGVNCAPVASPKLENITVLAKEPPSICKSKEGGRTQSKEVLKDDPVSSRLRSSRGAIRKHVPTSKNKQSSIHTGKQPVLKQRRSLYKR